MNRTKYAEIGYEKAGDGWRFVDAATGKHVGPCHPSERALLADLDREAWLYGLAPDPGGAARPVNNRLREALTWAVGFIRCNHPKAAVYPDFRNANDLIAEVGWLITGELQMTVARAEVAETERDRLRAFCESLEARLLKDGDPFSGDDWQLMQDVRAALGRQEPGETPAAPPGA